MPNSMTGFAEAEGIYSGFRVTWRLRSVNHRFLDLAFHGAEHWPGEWHTLERQASKRLQTFFVRGRLDCTLHLAAESPMEPPLKLDHARLKAILQVEKELKNYPGSEVRGCLSMDRLLAWPGLVQEYRPSEGNSPAFFQTTLALLDQAAHTLALSRATEGETLLQVILRALHDFVGWLERIEARLPLLREEQTQTLHKRIADLARSEVDKESLARELAILLNRADISEEIERLRLHLKELRLLLSGSNSVGRHLDFFCQELNREANTLSAKAQDAPITQAGLEMKLLIEKLREQAQNLE